MYINNLGHMTKMAAMPIYGKNPSKIIFSETNRLISRKLGVRHRWLKYSNVYINHDPVMTLTKFMARSTWVACASELGKLLKCHLKEKANRKLANGQNIEDSEKRKWPKGLSAPALELNTIIFKHVYWYMQLISGERLQDHWSSGFEGMVNQIYEPELKLNKDNISDTETPFLDLHLSVENGFVSSNIYDKRDDFDFDIVNFPFLAGDVPRCASYGVYIVVQSYYRLQRSK